MSSAVLPQHVRLMTQLEPGEMIVRKDGRDEFLAVGEGLVEITGDLAAIVTDMAVRAENIGEAKSKKSANVPWPAFGRSFPQKKSLPSMPRSLAHWHNYTSGAAAASDPRRGSRPFLLKKQEFTVLLCRVLL